MPGSIAFYDAAAEQVANAFAYVTIIAGIPREVHWPVFLMFASSVGILLASLRMRNEIAP